MENHLIELIEQLEEVLDHGTKVPLTGKIMVDSETILELLDGIRSVLPEEIRQANNLLAERDRYIEEARSEASRILDRAQKQADQLIQEDEIVTQSRAYGEEIVLKSQQYSREVKLGALKFADEMLLDIESKIGDAFKSIKASREELNSMTRWDDRVQSLDNE
ncbi:ATPase [Dehalobacter sp. DCM]|uniref:ATPase n=1 Tax=Dehalobacter sp. DCM TaxID=2907827 RepID=UPI003081FE8D|nr:ATPase [Dehalobacter sp. DCM]